MAVQGRDSLALTSTHCVPEQTAELHSGTVPYADEQSAFATATLGTIEQVPSMHAARLQKPVPLRLQLTELALFCGAQVPLWHRSSWHWFVTGGPFVHATPFR